MFFQDIRNSINEKVNSNPNKDIKLAFNKASSPKHPKNKALSQYSDQINKASMWGGDSNRRPNYSMQQNNQEANINNKIDNSTILPAFSIKSPMS
jgi:hypothetical protein